MRMIEENNIPYNLAFGFYIIRETIAIILSVTLA